MLLGRTGRPAGMIGRSGTLADERPIDQPASRGHPHLVMLPGLDGTGKLFAGFIRAIGADAKVQVIAYPHDEPLGYGELEALVRAAQLGIRRIDAAAAGGYNVFDEHNKIDAKRVLKLIQGRPKDYRLDGPLKLKFTHDARTEENLFTRIEMLVELLA